MQNEESLKQKTMKGLFWSFSDLFANQGIQFIIQIILARVLLPEHFGLIGMITVFISISNLIIDSGVSQALIREQNTTQAEYSTVFYFNLFMALIMYGFLFLLAPAISSFFHESKLTLILRVLSIGIIINSFGIIQKAQMIKKIDFKTQTKISFISGIVSGIIGTIFALLGFGVWSLIVKTISMQVIQSGLLWKFVGWIPSLVFKMESFRRLFGFGVKIMLAGLLSTIYSNIYYVIIGRYFAATQLGYFTNASKLNDVASQSITSALQSVTYPVLSKIQKEEEKLKFGFKKIIKTSTYIHFPIMMGLATIAEPLIHLLFGEKWMPMVIYFQLLCLAGMLYPLNAINLNILQVKGKSDLFLLISIVKKVLVTIMIILTIWLKLGVIGLVSLTIIDSYSSFWINSFFSGREISYSSFEQVKDISITFLMTIIMGATVYVCGAFLPDHDLMKIIIQIFMELVIYISMSKWVKVQELKEILQIMGPLLKREKIKNVKLTGRG
ncbi:lipopolysaccharide biosynthesis protein [Cytobacillus sp. Hz8]|uniref:lipopolysaccharide biosynthesis protein n=1 Tax=Cytobacillus sp. Hz8 TaxID=3347168 RepID=UPI0035D9A93F